MKDYAIVSLHEKGFWQVDVYYKLEQPPIEGDLPDHFKTFKIGKLWGHPYHYAWRPLISAFRCWR